MTIILGLAAACILLGILMCWGSRQLGITLLASVVYWVGVVLVVVGLILLLTPVLVWLNAQLRGMLGA